MKYILLFSALVLAGCQPDNIPEQQIKKIATVEGCNLYRIDVGPRYVYTTICPAGQSSSVTWKQGKSQPTQVDTVRK